MCFVFVCLFLQCATTKTRLRGWCPRFFQKRVMPKRRSGQRNLWLLMPSCQNALFWHSTRKYEWILRWIYLVICRDIYLILCTKARTWFQSWVLSGACGDAMCRLLLLRWGEYQAKNVGHIRRFRWLGPNFWWEISQICIEYIKPINMIKQMSDEPCKLFACTEYRPCHDILKNYRFDKIILKWCRLLQMFGVRITNDFCARNSNSMEAPPCSKFVAQLLLVIRITTNYICTCHDNTAITALESRLYVKMKRNFHRIWIAMEKR